MESYSSDAVILHHLDYGEADRIVTLFSLEGGLIKGFARQARKSRKRFGAALEPFSTVHVRWQTQRGGDLVTIQEADLIDLRSGLRHDLMALALAAYGCELIENLLGDIGPQPEAYHLLSAFLNHVHQHGGSPDARLILELRMLYLAGYEPHLLHCSRCGGPVCTEQVAFSASLGGGLCLDCVSGADVQRLSPMSLGSLSRILQAPGTLFEGFRFGPQTLREGGNAVNSLLNQHLCRPMKSLAFLDQLSDGYKRVSAIQ